MDHSNCKTKAKQRSGVYQFYNTRYYGVQNRVYSETINARNIVCVFVLCGTMIVVISCPKWNEIWSQSMWIFCPHCCHSCPSHSHGRTFNNIWSMLRHAMQHIMPIMILLTRHHYTYGTRFQRHLKIDAIHSMYYPHYYKVHAL